jgi:hypothetical protein
MPQDPSEAERHGADVTVPDGSLAVLIDLSRRHDKRLNQISGRLDLHNRRLEYVDQRFDEMDRRFRRVDMRFDQADDRFVQVEQRLDFIGVQLAEVLKLLAG